MPVLFLGSDVSKGYADFCFLSETGCLLGTRFTLDDTPAGHAALQARALRTLRQLQTRRAGPEGEPAREHSGPAPVRLVMGIEASGGLERNWLRTLRTLPTAIAAAPESRVFRLNPLAVKRFRDQELHHSVTDAGSAQTIAAFLLAGRQSVGTATFLEPREEGLLTRLRFACNCIDRKAQVQNELQNLLPVVHPDLVADAQQEFPQWLLSLLIRYPTVTRLARARSATLARIPYVTQERARALMDAAKKSVAALRDDQVGATVSALAKELRRLERQVASLKAALGRQLEEDPTVKLLVTIPGIALWSALILRLELGPLDRFPTAQAVVAFAGLDPRYHQSGDGEVRFSISKRGRSEVRAALYMCAFSALRWNPTIRAFYDRLRAADKLHDVAMCACMSKLLRIAYACVTRGEGFDPQRHEQVRQQHAERERLRRERQAAAQKPSEQASDPATEQPGSNTAGESAPANRKLATGAPTAPVSRREAKRRRAATAPQASVSRSERGRGAAPTAHDTPSKPMDEAGKKIRKSA
jgi:transposase